MKWASCCSGIGAPEVAWSGLGWDHRWCSEIDRFPSAVLAHHWPNVPNLGDMTKAVEHERFQTVDLLVGGTPCQSFSIAGKRLGLDDPRGGLALAYLKLARDCGTRWIVWENVPGVLSSDGGRDFGAFLGALGELRYGWAYRVLDAQYFGVAQRRRRVFVVGHLGDWRRAAAVLFEPASLRGDPAPCRGSREDVAVGIIKGAAIGRQPHNGPQYGKTLIDGTCYTLNTVENHAVAINTTGYQGDRVVDVGGTWPALSANGGNNGGGAGALALTPATVAIRGRDGGGAAPGVSVAGAVRRLTPRECERLQGFPDDHTLIAWRGKAACDGPRYKAIGNSMAVPVLAWIGERIASVEAAAALGSVAGDE